MAGFRATQGGVTARFAAPQARIIRDLVSQVAELVGGNKPSGGAGDLATELGITDNAARPEDPILARLLPDGYQQDPEAAGEFR